jgi:hypothetical protein
LKSVIEIPYIAADANIGSSTRLAAPAANQAMNEDFVMTMEIMYLTAQIQRWLNARVASHLAAQAEKLAR